MSKRTSLIVLIVCLVLIPVAFYATKAYGDWTLKNDFPFLKSSTVDLGPKPYGDFTGTITIKDGVPVEMHSTKRKRLKHFPGDAQA